MKGTSESAVGAALRQYGLYVYKPPDDARNWKPCDFMVWMTPSAGCGHTESSWIEVKSVRKGLSLPVRDIRPSQIAGVAEANRLGLPYWLVVRWGEPPRYDWSLLLLSLFAREHPGDWQQQIGKRTDHYWWDKFGPLKECVEMIVS